MDLPSDPNLRRRRRALLALAGAALVAGAIAGGGSGDPEGAARPAREAGEMPAPVVTELQRAEARMRELPLSRLAGQVIVLRFAGVTAPGYVRDALRRERAAGVILFRDNAPDGRSVRRLTRSLQGAAGGDALICIDQEGGAIRILPWLPPAPGQPAQSDPARSSRAAARALRAAGVNVNLAPVADMSGPVMGSRAYRGGTAEVARSVRAAVRAYRDSGVAPTAKHFPGLGPATVNTDHGPATITRGARSLGATDLPPFQAAVTAGVPLIMASHARYTALDRGNIASQSREILTELLRERMRFEGVIITDSLEAEAVQSLTGVEAAAIRSIRAGADIALLTGRGSYLPVLRALLAQARRSPAFRRRLVTAAARVHLLRQRLKREGRAAAG